MDKVFDPKTVEETIYTMWETGGYFTPKIDKKKKPFTVLLPPPNANADLHVGHAMYVIEDIMIRYHRMKGDPTLWLPGADHAGFETQFVYEKHLAKLGKSRFDFDRETLYKDIWNFVHENRGKMENQLRRLGFSLDWSRNVFTLDPSVVKTVYESFKQLSDEGLVYRDSRLVNYCTKDGTGFSDLEVLYVERTDPLYYMKYGPFTIATTRPETKFRDTALAVNPKDKRYKKYIGQTLEIMGLLGPVNMTVIPDPEVDPKFGTGIMKVTPAHDPHDFELGKQFNLPVAPIIDFRGKMDFSWFLEQKNIDAKYRERAEKYHGKKVAMVRPLMVEDLKADGLLIKIDEAYTHRIGTCWKCGTVIEPLPLEQWYVRVAPLAKEATDVIKKKKVTFVPKRFEKIAATWLTNFHDWNISRQNVWGIRIPAWKCSSCADWTVTAGEQPEACRSCTKATLTQDTDTFDTWFSSGQWPFATLKATRPDDFDYFYPTSVMETGYDILPWWVCRMLMLGIHLTGKVPFETVYLHGLVRDGKGQKMSKSKGNVINPLKMIDLYGTDALRMALVFGTGAGNDQSLSEDKIRGMRNFSNKLWNIARFILMTCEGKGIKYIGPQMPVSFSTHTHTQVWCAEELNNSSKFRKTVTQHMEKNRFNSAAEELYEYAWHNFADTFLENAKSFLSKNDPDSDYVRGTLIDIYYRIITMLHPFMPFITEAIWNEMKKQIGDNLPHTNKAPMIISPWST